MECEKNEDVELFNTAMSEVNSLFALIKILQESQQQKLLHEIQLRILEYTGKGRRRSSASSPKTNNRQVAEENSGQAKVTAENGAALTIRPCFLRLVPLSRSQTQVLPSSAEDTKTVQKTEDETEWAEEEDVDDPDFPGENLSDSDGNYSDFQRTPCVKAARTAKKPRQKSHKRKSGKTYRCEKCEKSFSQKAGLDVHLKRHNGVKSFACSLCEYHAVCKIDILRHMSKHTGERKHCCKFCNKAFTTDSSLRNHVRHIHVRQDKVTCDQCSFQTHSKDILRRHRLIKHTSQETFECPVCHEVVKQKGSFTVHMRKHTGEKPYPCKVCSKSFKSSSQLAAHSRTHRPGQYICSHCSRDFTTKHHLDRHKVVHTGEKPYLCHLCTYACNVKANVTKHIRTVHKVYSFSFREPYPVSKGPDDNPAALERGNKAAHEYLKEHTLKGGEILTLEDLRRHSQEQRESQQEAKLKELRQKKAKVPKTCARVTPNPLPASDHQIVSINVQETTVEPSLVDTCTSDILSDAVQLLNSSDQDACTDEGNAQYKAVGETVNIPFEIGSNMYLIQVVPDENMTF